MSIADPHAIPESEHDCAEYLKEADEAWDAGNTELAKHLYIALTTSHFAPKAAASHADHRIGLIALNDGDTELALHHLNMSDEPGAADALRSITNATHDDPTPSGDVIPETLEQVYAWHAAAKKAKDASDWNTAYELWVAAAASTASPPGVLATVQANAGVAAHNLSWDDLAQQWMQVALPNLTDDEGLLTHIRGLLAQYGGAHVDADDDSPAAAQVAAGIQAYENGDAHGAKTALEAALHLEGPEYEKGKAHYYLGAMAYQEHHYADARNHFDACLATAPEQERSWAELALQWRWDQSPAS